MGPLESLPTVQPGGGGFDGPERSVEMTALPLLPHDLAAEQQLLGACLLDGSIMQRAAALLVPDDFYHPQHRRFWRAMLACTDDGMPSDPVRIASWMTAQGDARPGDMADLALLWDAVIVPKAARIHIPILVRLSVTRQLILDSVYWQEAASHPGCDAARLVQTAWEQLGVLRARLRGAPPYEQYPHE